MTADEAFLRRILVGLICASVTAGAIGGVISLQVLKAPSHAQLGELH